MSATYIEKDCTIVHEGRSYTSGGAYVTDDRVTAYLGRDRVLTDWNGRPIGSYRITSTWSNPRGWFSGEMHQIEAVIDGRTYTGRSGGVGMVFTGRRVARERVAS